MYSDQVFCFTPKGDVIQLPRGATPLDYAYAIHTRIGNSCVSAKIDGIRVPLWTRLKNGQSVEIITAEGQRPRAAFDHVGKKATEKALRTAAKMLGLSDENDLLARLGSAEMPARRVVETLYPELAQAVAEEVDSKRPVVGLTADQTFRRAQCCQPVPGERIVGITYKGLGVVVHAIDCPALEEFEDQTQRWVDLRWHSGRHAPVYMVTLDLTISNDAGVLGRICTLIGEQKANISDLRFTDRKPDFYRLIMDVDLRDVEHLHMVMTALEAETDVAQISRHRDLARRP
jgi:GTP pyrophosphokinase/guanosine-3',5'-bis(diphosphate) 3'-pyrophosphohydrolase